MWLIREIVKKIDMWGVNMLFVVGGNGGNAGANAIHQYCKEQGVHCSVVGVPKSIDNDILLVGFGIGCFRCSRSQSSQIMDHCLVCSDRQMFWI